MRSQSTECLPFPMILMGTISAFMWLLYGIILSDAFIQVRYVQLKRHYCSSNLKKFLQVLLMKKLFFNTP